MITRRRLIATFALLCQGSAIARAGQNQERPAEPTTVTLIIEGMT